MIIGNQYEYERILKINSIKEKIMRKNILCCFLFVFLLSFISPAYSCKYVHHLDTNEEINAIHVSKSSRHSFPQEGYTYSFPVCDEDDIDILNTLKVDAYASFTKGTYSISIDYTDSKDRYVHRRTGYLVTDNLESIKDSLPYPDNKVYEKDGRILFHSNKAYAPRDLNENCFSDVKSGFAQALYHMENALLPCLYDNEVFINRIKDKIPAGKTILGVCIKIYCSYDFCSQCCANILTLAPYLQAKFSQYFSHSPNSIPLTILGLAYRPYGNYGYLDANGKDLKKEFGADLYLQNEFITFNGTIHGGSPQSILPIYLCAQPDTPQSKKRTLTLNQGEK